MKKRSKKWRTAKPTTEQRDAPRRAWMAGITEEMKRGFERLPGWGVPITKCKDCGRDLSIGKGHTMICFCGTEESP